MSDKNPDQANELDALFTLATEHKMAVEVLIDLIGIPKELALRGLSAAVFVSILRLDENAKSMLDERKYHRDFDELCSTFPNVSVECFRLLGMASVSIDMFFMGPQSENNVRDKVMHLMNSSMSLGGATALLPVSIGYLSAKVQAERKAMLSAAGMAIKQLFFCKFRELVLSCCADAPNQGFMVR